MSGHYLQGRAAASWEGCSTTGAPSALLRLIPIAGKSSFKGRKKGSLKSSQFGMMYAPSTVNLGKVTSTLSLEGSPARTSAPQEKVLDWRVKDRVSGKTLRGSSARFDHATFSWRIALASQGLGLTKFSVTWPRWGSMRNGVCWALPTQERPTYGNGSGFWPTPNASDHIQRKTSASWKAKGRVNFVLSNPEITGVTGGQLNPPWVEWLMGWPIGWTDLEPLETDKFRQWLHSHLNY